MPSTRSLRLDRSLDLADNMLRLLHSPVGHQPARALRQDPADDQDEEPENGSDADAEPPAGVVGDQIRIEQGDRHGRADGGAQATSLR